MAALVATERHLWLSLSDMGDREKAFLLDAPLSPEGRFGPAIGSVVERFQEERRQAAGFQKFLPRRSRVAGAVGRGQPRPAPSTAHRAQQRGGRTAGGGPHQGSRELLLVPSAGKGLRWPRRAFSRGPELSNQLFPASALSQGTKSAVPVIPEASLDRLVPLVDVLAEWKNLPNISQWVLRIIESGYAIQFRTHPPRFNGVLPIVVGPEQALVLEQEVQTLLLKGAIERVLLPSRESGWYSRYFVVPKKDWGLRPILDLRLLNQTVGRLSFKMLTLKQIVSQIRSEDWFDTIDLNDAYFHPPTTQEVPEVRFRGRSVPVSGSSVRPSTLSPYVHEMYRRCPGAVATPGHTHLKLHRRLVDSGSFGASSGLTSRCRSGSHQQTGVEAQC
ncbi:hypothetical protein DPEC_G00107360 [Dallia pectoralis]|uniref:Uncharacterized protein n=1 Tax=Dallia pectoralis TaxID=75939 RepID=A0ACC2GS87_DALPE|nr:hypothetical protein DPEC_G00107360 [Dallia pectoralis]